MAGRRPMRLGDPMDQALQEATLAISSGTRRPASRFASIELRSESARLNRLAPLGYLCSVLLGIAVVLVLWFL